MTTQIMRKAWGVLLVFGTSGSELVKDEEGQPVMFRTKALAEIRQRYQGELGFKARVVAVDITYTYFQP